jgi:hypothetical protein
LGSFVSELDVQDAALKSKCIAYSWHGKYTPDSPYYNMAYGLPEGVDLSRTHADDRIVSAILGQYLKKTSWAAVPDVSFVYGKVNPSKDSTDGTVKFLGKFDDLSRSQLEAAASNLGCIAYTWHNKVSTTSPYYLLAYGIMPGATLSPRNDPTVFSATSG